MTINICPNRKNKPRVPCEACQARIKKRDPVCFERYKGGTYKCEIVRKEKGK